MWFLHFLFFAAHWRPRRSPSSSTPSLNTRQDYYSFCPLFGCLENNSIEFLIILLLFSSFIVFFHHWIRVRRSSPSLLLRKFCSFIFMKISEFSRFVSLCDLIFFFIVIVGDVLATVSCVLSFCLCFGVFGFCLVAGIVAAKKRVES